jgi:guanine deaminase
MCLGAIMWARISKVHYGCTADEAAAIGFDDKAFYQAFATPDKNEFLTMEHHENAQCHSLFKKWMALDNKVMY